MKLLFSLFISSFLFANDWNKNSSDYAIGGYDTVAYFKEKKAVRGSKEFSYKWKKFTWLFSSEINKEEFMANPQKYAPVYGGFCAYGVSNGYKVGIDPKAWTIYEDKLYLNYSIGVRRSWLKRTDFHLERADENWKRLTKKKEL